MHSQTTSDDAIQAAATLVEASSRIVALTGAGISTDSGIPDFRGPNGVWTRDPEAEKQSTISHYLSDPAIRERAWRSRMDHRAWSAEPNAGHRALVQLEAQRKLLLLVTQNIDGLHQEAGSDPERIVEIHGTMREVACLDCGWRGPMTETLDRVRAGEPDPPCLVCGGILKSATISFGQNLVAEDVDRAFAAAEAADLILAVGSTLGVYPVANMVPVGVRAGASIVIVNGEGTEMDDLATVVVRGSISDVLPRIVGGAASR
ncbi:MAG: Sir2 family NAD-dependent protein deacetylase [Microthrixaceae bacterium]|nr:Sir2 family NAD-dependent protein deacetylase [Microthrixaceae bacterium]